MKFYKAEKGWGAISSPDLPPGYDAWVHFSAIQTDPPNSYHSFVAGQEVEFEFEKVKQDSFDYRATWARALE